jgi:hypothetical protein
MPGLLSGSILRSGGSQTFIRLQDAQPQLPPTPTTSTGYTLQTSDLLVTQYRSSLGNLEMSEGTIYSNIFNGNITLAGTGTGVVVVTGGALATSTNTGALVVQGGISSTQDIVVNSILFGQGFQGYNNISVTGLSVDTEIETNDGQLNLIFGLSALEGIETAYKNISIGRFALSSGTYLSNNIAIGDSALKALGTLQAWPIGNITGITQSATTVIEVVGHGVSTGTELIITGLTDGPIELNNINYWVDVVDADHLALYVDNILFEPLDTSGLPPYVSGGVAGDPLIFNRNIAIGIDSGSNLIDGEQNLFVGSNVADNLTTGSYNIFLGHEVGNNMISGTGNISIGGDNLIDGVDNQVNIGSVLYYDGGGNLYVNSDQVVGLGTNSTSSTTGALTVIGGVGILDDLYVGGTIYGTVVGTQIVETEVNTATNAKNVKINPIATSATYYLTVADQTSTNYALIGAEQKLNYITRPYSTLTNYFNTGNNMLNVPGSIFSNEGNGTEGNLLYTPRVLVGTATVVTSITPRVGDFWIDIETNAEYQYIDDDGQRFWLQIAII